MSVQKSCLKGSTSYQNKHIARYCLPGSCPHALNPGTLSRVTDASLSTALQAGRYLHANLIQKFLFRLKSNTSLSVTCCLQASGRYLYDNTDNGDNKPSATEKLSLLSSQKKLCAENLTEVISVVFVVCHFVTFYVAPILPVVSVVPVVVKPQKINFT